MHPPSSPLPPFATPRAPLPHLDLDLDAELVRFEMLVPPVMGKLLAYTQRPGSFAYRLPIALLFIAGGCAGFLPVLGLWMVPLGLLLIVQDIRPLRPQLARALGWVNGWLERRDAREGNVRQRPSRCVTEAKLARAAKCHAPEARATAKP